MLSATTIETPVLIVGAGPVGLALAADLGRGGAPGSAVEERTVVSERRRALAINARAMESMPGCGHADKLWEVGTPPDFAHAARSCPRGCGFRTARIVRPHHG